MKKPVKPEMIIIISLIVLITGFSSIAEIIHRTSDIFQGFIDQLVFKILGFLLMGLGVFWIWWTGHLMRALVLGASLRLTFPLTFARHPYYASALYAFYPGIALVTGRFELLIASIILIIITHLFVFRLPGTLTEDEKEAKKEGKLQEKFIEARTASVKDSLLKDDVVSPGKYLLRFGKLTEFAEIYTYFFLIVLALELFVNPLPEFMSFNLQLGLVILIGFLTLTWSSWSIWAVLKSPKEHFRNIGPYRFCKYPLHSAFIFGLYPLVMVILNSGEFLIAFPFLLTVAHMIVREEEFYKQKVFGDKWTQYSVTHPRFIPYFGANKENAGEKREKFAFKTLILSGLLFVIALIMFGLALVGVFSVNYDSMFIMIILFLFVMSVIAMLPSWERYKKICTVIAFVITLLFVILFNHIQVSKAIQNDITNFVTEVQNPKSEGWFTSVDSNVFLLNGNVRINAEQFIQDHEKLIHNLKVGVEREITSYKHSDFIFPFVDRDLTVFVTLSISDNAPQKPVKASDASMSAPVESKIDPYKADELKLEFVLHKQKYEDWRKDLDLPEFRIRSIKLEN